MTTISLEEPPPVRFALRLADAACVLAHRLGEWSGQAPTLEEDLALSNLALDLLGQARALYTHAAALDGHGRDEDALAFLRDAPQYRNPLLVELPNGDFARTMLRHLFFSAWALPFWRSMKAHEDPTLAAIAAKAEKEMAYHLRHASAWVVRLGDGTAESHARCLAALEDLWPFTAELHDRDAVDEALHAPNVRAEWQATVARVLAEATLPQPRDGWMQRGGRDGVHSEHLGHILAVMQHLPRSYPGATW